MTTVYLNGNFTPLREARISVLDRGFTFADGVYEVIPVFSGKPLRLPEHLKRLRTSLDAISLHLDYDGEQWRVLIDRLLGLNQARGDSTVYIQITRGVVDERDHLYQADYTPTVFACCKPLQLPDLSEGISAVLHEDIRWQHCNIKAVTLLPNVMMKQYARNKDGSHEAILHRGEYITEGAASNVFIVRDSIISTPPKNSLLLAGITRDLVVELIAGTDYEGRETAVSKTGLLQADEIWITSSTLGIAPVVRLDGQPVNGGKPGPVWHDLNAVFQAFIEDKRQAS